MPVIIDGKPKRRPVTPASAVARFRDPEVRKRFDAAMKKLRIQSEPLLRACRESERITAADLAVTINCRDTD